MAQDKLKGLGFCRYGKSYFEEYLVLVAPSKSNVILPISRKLFFFSGEGPRSRRYGRTAAMRLIVQPYDEDEDDDYFLPFS
jgi:hypothetical protein